MGRREGFLLVGSSRIRALTWEPERLGGTAFSAWRHSPADQADHKATDCLELKKKKALIPSCWISYCILKDLSAWKKQREKQQDSAPQQSGHSLRREKMNTPGTSSSLSLASPRAAAPTMLSGSSWPGPSQVSWWTGMLQIHRTAWTLWAV